MEPFGNKTDRDGRTCLTVPRSIAPIRDEPLAPVPDVGSTRNAPHPAINLLLHQASDSASPSGRLTLRGLLTPDGSDTFCGSFFALSRSAM